MPIQVNDINRDGRIDATEWRRPARPVTPNEVVEVIASDGRIIRMRFSEFQAGLQRGGISLAGDVRPPAESESARLRGILNDVSVRIQEALRQGNQAEAQRLREQLAETVSAASKMENSGVDLTPYKQMLSEESAQDSRHQNLGGEEGGLRNIGGNLNGGAPAAVRLGANPKAEGAGGGALGDGPTPDPSAAYASAIMATDSEADAWTQINNNTNRGKQLMMIFWRLAKQAASGDFHAIYRFMNFLTYVISKDKSLQQIQMGQQLIRLQEMSRQYTNRLLNLSTDSNNPSASSELMKEMTIVRSETDAIATSQKLISQMMEEMAQVVETLTNTTKAALEANGRIQRTVSTIRV